MCRLLCLTVLYNYSVTVLFIKKKFYKSFRSELSNLSYGKVSSNICAMDKLSRVSSVRMSSVDRTAIMKLNRIEPRELVHHEHFAT